MITIKTRDMRIAFYAWVIGVFFGICIIIATTECPECEKGYVDCSTILKFMGEMEELNRQYIPFTENGATYWYCNGWKSKVNNQPNTTAIWNQTLIDKWYKERYGNLVTINTSMKKCCYPTNCPQSINNPKDCNCEYQIYCTRKPTTLSITEYDNITIYSDGNSYYEFGNVSVVCKDMECINYYNVVPTVEIVPNRPKECSVDKIGNVLSVTMGGKNE